MTTLYVSPDAEVTTSNRTAAPVEEKAEAAPVAKQKAKPEPKAESTPPVLDVSAVPAPLTRLKGKNGRDATLIGMDPVKGKVVYRYDDSDAYSASTMERFVSMFGGKG